MSIEPWLLSYLLESCLSRREYREPKDQSISESLESRSKQVGVARESSASNSDEARATKQRQESEWQSVNIETTEKV